jgi:predicted DCC family thiol-disulfide oxidoreductase YuxK
MFLKVLSPRRRVPAFPRHFILARCLGSALCSFEVIDVADYGPFRILVDGACPICRQQGDLLRWLDAGRNRILIEDIAHPDFDPRRYGLTIDQVMSEIHGITWDGRVLAGMEVFRKAYDLLGLGFLAAPTGWPVFRPFFDAAYRWFSRNRHRLTGQTAGFHADACRPR